ncbi:DNA-binding transcriptional response regulator, NtrC family, contains REC, AAA-type ATPase, and a Fis-type DNA-binding domains [Caloramator quimbayensis]|uniref:Stage 0 sporulation protein A homolog n=1 Tax=Caloramator quimbayensis TaxID=1147123 RepID=A0A1T4WJT6_9CLOT|nr:sigma-54 dependent transcriptional regulator [Caloramator quimbayensis]SKA77439.1 DNA-binding transcriptional response regulator, NtrC family, contains REC, AAA-type ATPase, and a Fis-type DNA-binding domains [Caloramator quimbayensis]
MSDICKILIVDDEKEYRETYRIILESRGYIVGEAGSAKETLDILDYEYYPLVLSDIIMPDMDGLELLKEIKNRYDKSVEVIMVTGYGSIETAVNAMKMGAFGYFIKSHNPEELLIEIEKAKKIVNFQNQKIISINKKEGRRFLNQSKNPKMKEILNIIDTVASSNTNVLLLGESGVGKEVIAHMLHEKSNRSSMPFVAINCQAFSDNLLESELFGHEKGAFTGALDRRIGRFEQANGGTIFLDEIGEMSLNTQVKLLRVLEDKKIERVGSNKPINVDFRLIAATNRDIRREIKKGSFREDLYYRINTITIEIPPLRERKEDILDMINFFINLFSKELKKEIRGIDDETLEYLTKYDYPGNIRELKNIIERLVVLSKDGILRVKSTLEKTGKINSNNESSIIPYKEARRRFETEYILNVLKYCSNNITQAASIMNISRRQLFNKIIELNLKEHME